MSTVIEQLSRLLAEDGFEHFGFAEVTTPFSMDLYDQWLKDGMHGEMDYLVRQAADRRNPQKFYKRARTAIVVTLNYVPHPAPKEGWPLSNATRVAAYARGRDYHRFFHHRLKALAARMTDAFPGEEFQSFTDAGAILERDLAARAGLGWIGKNTCLLNRERGSLFLLGEIYASIEIPTLKFDRAALEKDFCGTCTRCIDACPTGALVEPRKLDARKCISYLNIESKYNPPEALREKMGDWLFGCDICQTVCPWNLKAYGRDVIESLNPPIDSRESLIKDLRYLLNSPNRKLERDFEATPLARINGIGLKRNALVVAGNKKLVELRPDIEPFATHHRIGDLAKWALTQLQ